MGEDKRLGWNGKTWFGTRIEEAQNLFNLSHKKGQEYIDMTISKIDHFNNTLMDFQNDVDISKIRKCRDMINSIVSNERTMLWFTVNKSIAQKNVENGVAEYLRFFTFNIRSIEQPRNYLYLLKVFEKELSREYKKVIFDDHGNTHVKNVYGELRLD